ncbi:MAG: hypothetical protein ABI863_08300 [Ginsengibacter sp.]
MNIHLLRSKEYAVEEFEQVVDFLRLFDGPVRFVADGVMPGYGEIDPPIEKVDKKKFFKKEKVNLMADYDICLSIPEERPVAKWESLFMRCKRYQEENIIDRDDMVLLLTNTANEHNWFCALNPAHPADGFVHTDDWEHYVNASAAFPVAYLVASLVLQKHMFPNLNEFHKVIHQTAIGCINDFCENKKEIALKMLTGYICPGCMNLLERNLNPIAIQQVLSIFEGVRRRLLFHQDIQENRRLSPLKITNQNKIILPDYGNMEIKLRPLEKTLYLFFLQHPDGVMLHDLVDHKDELRSIYSRISTSGLLAEIHDRVNSLVDVTSNSASEKISKIKAAFKSSIGEELSKHYIIKGENGCRKSISLDRSFVFPGSNI